MYNTTKIFIRSGNPLYSFFVDHSEKSKNLRNVSTFLMRNTRTALAKDEKNRHPHEQEVLEKVMQGLNAANETKIKNYNKKKDKILSSDIPEQKKNKELEKLNKKLKLFKLPTKEHPWLSYEKIDAILKKTKDPDYYALPSQVNQQAIRKSCDSFHAFFESIKSYTNNKDPYTGRPKLPGYIRSSRATVTYTNQVCRENPDNDKMYFSFPGTDLMLDAGPVKNYKGKFIKLEVRPIYEAFEVCITYEDADLMIPEVPGDPKRIMGIDVGVDNFLSCVTNFPATPFIISGKWLKMENQYFNKERARLLSELTHGEDSSHSKKKSNRITELSRRRSHVFRDFFYKSAHAVCRVCRQRDVELIVIGHNEGQKQEISTGGINNQNFVSIPFTEMIETLVIVAAKYGIPVIQREESYTSKASLIDMDVIPTYEKGDKTRYQFSGRRVHRGLYQTKDGHELNADINGAGNIIRKEYPDAFKDVKDLSYLWKTTLVISREELINNQHIQGKGMKALRRKREQENRRKHERSKKKFLYMKLFEARTSCRRVPKKKPTDQKNVAA